MNVSRGLALLPIVCLACGCSVAKKPYLDQKAVLQSTLDRLDAAALVATAHARDPRKVARALAPTPTAGSDDHDDTNTVVVGARGIGRPEAPRDELALLIGPSYCLAEASAVVRTGKWPTTGRHRSRDNSQGCVEYLARVRYALVLTKHESEVGGTLVDLHSMDVACSFSVPIAGSEPLAVYEVRSALAPAFASACANASYAKVGI